MSPLIYQNDLPLIKPQWPAPSNVQVFSTTRLGGVSTEPFDTFNLSINSTEGKTHPLENREILKYALDLPEHPRWLSQTHSIEAKDALDITQTTQADASYTNQINTVCAVLTADCLPIIVCNKAGTKVAAIHAGWRGLLNGIIETTITKLNEPPESLLIWLGPAISQKAFEVGQEVYDAFLSKNTEAKEAFIFTPKTQRYYADLYQLARLRLFQLDISYKNIYGGEFCTFSQPNLFYSYRRDQNNSGRIATLAWLTSPKTSQHTLEK